MKVTFSADIDLPDGTPESDIYEWLEFEIGARGRLSASNSLADTDLISVGCKSVQVQA